MASTIMHVLITCVEPGADPGFSFGGGGAKDYVPHAHYERGTELTFGRGRLKGPGSSRVVLMLSRAI